MAEEIGGIDSKSLAETVAAAAVAAAPEVPEVAPGQEPPLEGLEPGLEPPVVDTPPPVEPVPEVPEEFPTLDDHTLELARMGIDLGVSRAELPADMQPIYDRLAQQAITYAQAQQAKSAQLEEAQAEIHQFAQKLQDDPQKVLLTMALTNPEAFRETIEAYDRMQEDEFYKNTMIKDLQAEAKLAASQRQEQMWQQRAIKQRIAQVTRATHMAADHYGVSHELAEEFVAGAVTRNGGDIELSQIGPIVARLAPTGRTIPPQEKVARTAQAPTTSVAGTGQPVASTGSSDPEISPGLTRANRNPFLDLVRGAAGRVGQPKE